jgi:hypothetical protein
LNTETLIIILQINAISRKKEAEIMKPKIIKRLWRKYPITTVVFSTGIPAVICACFKGIYYSFIPKLLSAQQVQLLLVVIALLFFLFAFFLSISIDLWRAQRMTLLGGVYLDKTNPPQAHCPSCRTALSGYHYDTAGSWFRCTKCKEDVHLADAEGRPLSYKEVQEEVIIQRGKTQTKIIAKT